MPANGPETETDESTTDESSLAANVAAFKVAIAETKKMNPIQNECDDLFCVKWIKPTGDQSGDNISNT